MTHTSTEQPEALRLADAIEKCVPTPTKAEVAAELRRLHARVQELEKAESDLITERDRRDEIIDRIADAVLGDDRHEWSSAYDLEDAAQDVEDRMCALKELEAPQAQRAPLTPYTLREIIKKLNDDDDEGGWNFGDLAREVEIYHGITQEKQ